MNKNRIKIGDVIWVRLHGKGHVQRGIRPAVVIQNNVGNYHSPTIQVFSMTSRCYKTSLPTHVFVPSGVAGLDKNSIVQCEATHTIDKEDVLGYIGHLPDKYMNMISLACMISIPLIQFLSTDQIRDVCSQVHLLA